MYADENDWSCVKPNIVFSVWLGLGQIEFLREFLNFFLPAMWLNFCPGLTRPPKHPETLAGLSSLLKAPQAF